MMPTALVCSVLLATTGSLTAQFFIAEKSIPRRLSRVAWLGKSGEQRIVIEHGRPKWSSNYDKFMQGRTSRHVGLGSDAWSTLQSDVDLAFGDKTLPRGRWYLGLHRDEQQVWSLTMSRPETTDAARVGPGETVGLKPELEVPMRLESNAENVELLEITLAVIKKRKQNVALSIAWGSYRARVELTAGFDARVPEGTPEFALPSPDKAITTGSGLQYEQLRPGVGGSPRPTDTVRVHYASWFADGSLFDSSYLRGEPTTLPVRHVVKGFAEALELMRPGATFRLAMPPDLGYGANGAGDRIPPNATLVFTVTLLGIEK